MRAKLLVLDIDGTLVPDGENRVPEENIAAIRAAQRAGVRVTLATARTFRMASVIACQLQLDTPLICHGGAYLVNMDGTCIRHIPLAYDFAEEMACFADAEGHRLVTTIDECNFIPHCYHPGVDAPFEDLIFVESNRAALSSEPTRVATLDEAGSHALYRRFSADSRVNLARFYRQEMLYCVAAFHPQATKGMAVRLLGEHLGVSMSEVVVMGDMETDISMFQVAGCSVAMPHSPAEVKRAATHLAPAGEFAVAWAINHLLGIEPVAA